MLKRILKWWRGLYSPKTEEPERPFTSDGCSGGMSFVWKKFTGRELPWAAACVQHDREYWRGGTAADRREADRWLMIGVADSGHEIWAFIMWTAVRIGGAPWLPFGWRWGFGTPFFTIRLKEN